MKQYTVELKSSSHYSQSKHYEVAKTQGETSDAHERRTWRERCHYTDAGHVFIPAMAIRNCLSEAAKFAGIQIPGKGKSNYTKHFEAGISMVEDIVLPETRDTIEGEWFFVPADGKRGGAKRVKKCFPVVKAWTGVTEIIVFDETITEKVLLQHLEIAGKFIGIGRFRPRNNGFYGRFDVKKLQQQ